MQLLLFTFSLKMLITTTVFYLLQTNALKHEQQLMCAQFHRGIRVVGGQFKGAFFQSFVVYGEPVPVPGQQLDVRVVAVHENEHISVHWVLMEFILNDTAKPVKTFPDIGGMSVQPIPACGRQLEHRMSV
jgi:hypothetical protein